MVIKIWNAALATTLSFAVAGHDLARTANNPADTSRESAPKSAFFVMAGSTTATDTELRIGYTYVPNTITDEEYPKPVPERPTLTIKSS